MQVGDFSVMHGHPHITLMTCDWGGLKSGFVSLDGCEHSLCACWVGVYTLNMCDPDLLNGPFEACFENFILTLL